MALIECPECNKEISDKAVSCPNCGYPMADGKTVKSKPRPRKSKETSVDYIDPRFPILPDELGIGSPLSQFTSKYNFTGERIHDDCSNLDFILSSKLKFEIHKKGLRVMEVIEDRNSKLKPISIDLHFSMIVNIKQSTLLSVKQFKKPDSNEMPLSELLVLDEWSKNENDVKFWLKFNRESWKNTDVIVLNYWNKKLKMPATLVARGKDSSISKFVNAFNVAKQNYDNGIPNVYDKEGDINYSIRVVILMVISVIISLYIFNYCS